MNDDALYSIDSEKAVIGCIIIDNSDIKKVREILSHDDFYDKRHKYIFRAIEWLDNNKVEADLLTICDALKKKNLLEQIGGSAYISELTSSAPLSSRVLIYSKIVSDYSSKRKISLMANDISRASSNEFTLDETLEKVRNRISEINNIGGKQNKYQVELMADYIDSSIERYKNFGKMQGISTGFPSIDKLMLGLVGGELIIIAGPTSKGKTTLAMNISNNIALQGYKILFVTLEMTQEELTSRFMYINGGYDTSNFSIVCANIIFQKVEKLSWKDIDGLMDNAKQQLNVDLVIIDHLHYFARGMTNSAEDLGVITQSFKDSAKKHKMPIILISHIRKLLKDEELSGDSLRGSSFIAQDSDIVLLVNRDPETNAMGVMIDKNRNRGKLSDRTKDWNGQSEREINTVYLEFNNTKLKDPLDGLQVALQVFPDAVQYKG